MNRSYLHVDPQKLRKNTRMIMAAGGTAALNYLAAFLVQRFTPCLLMFLLSGGLIPIMIAERPEKRNMPAVVGAWILAYVSTIAFVPISWQSLVISTAATSAVLAICIAIIYRPKFTRKPRHKK